MHVCVCVSVVQPKQAHGEIYGDILHMKNCMAVFSHTDLSVSVLSIPVIKLDVSRYLFVILNV